MRAQIDMIIALSVSELLVREVITSISISYHVISLFYGYCSWGGLKQGSTNCEILLFRIRHHGESLENMENMEKMESINQMSQRNLFMTQNTVFITTVEKS